MAMALFEGTKEDVINYLTKYSGDAPNERFKVFIEPEPALTEDEEDLYPNLPAPPFTVRDRAHLFELLDAGLASPTERVTEEYWEDIRCEVQRRDDERKKQK